MLCSEALADYLLQFARHLIYSTAMPPAQAVALSAALAVIRSDEGQQRRETLAGHIADFRRECPTIPASSLIPAARSNR